MLNCVSLIGRLTADPELRTTMAGKEVCSFAIAVDRSYAKPGEQRQTDFINIVVWESTANFVCRYFKKGSMIALQGSIQTRNYEAKDGTKRTAFEVVAKEVSFCSGKNESTKPEQSQQGYLSLDIQKLLDFEEITTDEDLPF